MEMQTRTEYVRGEKQIFPVHGMVKSWQFADGEEEEAMLANAMAKVAEKNGMSVNTLQHLFPAVLRMLQCTTSWSK